MYMLQKLYELMNDSKEDIEEITTPEEITKENAQVSATHINLPNRQQHKTKHTANEEERSRPTGTKPR